MHSSFRILCRAHGRFMPIHPRMMPYKCRPRRAVCAFVVSRINIHLQTIEGGHH